MNNALYLSSFQTLAQRIDQELPAYLTDTAFLISNWRWLGLLFLSLLVVVVDRIIRSIVARVGKRIAARDRIQLEPERIVSFARPLGLLMGVIAFEILLPALELSEGVTNVILLASSLVVAVAGVWAAYRLVDLFCDTLAIKASRTANRFDDMLVPLARRTLKIFVVIVGMVFVGSRLSEDLWGIVAGLGLGSIAIGFAARDSIENLFGTFTVLLDKPFQVGDWVLVDDVEGTVEEVGFRSTRIRTFYDSIVTVPNRTFIATSIDNMGNRRYRRVKTLLSLSYDTPPVRIEAFCEGVREIIRSHPYTRKDSYHVYLNRFGDSALEVLLYCFVATPDWATELREKHRLYADILRLAERLGVSFAFPTRTLHLLRPEDLESSGVAPDPPVGSGSDAPGVDLGRRAAHAVVEGSLQEFGGIRGSKPAPVETYRAPMHARGEHADPESSN